jgi:hypothetical protein
VKPVTADDLVTPIDETRPKEIYPMSDSESYQAEKKRFVRTMELQIQQQRKP